MSPQNQLWNTNVRPPFRANINGVPARRVSLSIEKQNQGRVPILSSRLFDISDSLSYLSGGCSPNEDLVIRQGSIPIVVESYVYI